MLPTPTHTFLLCVRSEECAEEVAQAQIESLCKEPATAIAPRVLLFHANEKDLAAVLGLEVFGTLSLVPTSIFASSTDSLLSFFQMMHVDVPNCMPVINKYRAWRGKGEIHSPSFKIFFRCQFSPAPDPRALVAALSAALTGAGWRAQMDEPDLHIVLYLLSSTSAHVAIELRAQGQLASGSMRPDLSNLQSEDYVKRMKAELRSRQRSKKKRIDQQRLETGSEQAATARLGASSGTSGTAGASGAPQEASEDAPKRLARAEAILQARTSASYSQNASSFTHLPLAGTSRFIIILERSSDEHNQYAILRTAESMGIQHVWFILHPAHAASFHINRKITKVP